MLESIKKQWSAKIALILFITLTAWWIILQFMHLPHESEYNQLWGAVYGLVALWGGICGVIVARKWGGLHSVMGKSIYFFALGLFSQEVGQVLYSYYIYFLNQPVPYPSIGDLFFWTTIPLYIIGVLFLAKASAVHISLKSVLGKTQAIIIPVGILLLCYFVFLQEYKFDWSNPIKILIDFGVPIGESIYISFAVLTYTLTKRVLGGVMKKYILFILFALLAEFAADWTFLYQASREIWYAGGMNDYMYLFAFFLMTLGVIQFDTVYKKLREKK